ncbi:MAG: hypothetical protein JWM36_2093 [Hyphomicrobiales bacterium]|nr:hypothetical protein [Hyphomicrobiales bacterium]
MVPGRKRNRSLDPAAGEDLAAAIARMASMGVEQLRDVWRQRCGGEPPSALTKDLLLRALCHQLQEQRLGALDKPLKRLLAQAGRNGSAPPARIKVGSVIVREYQGTVHEVVVVQDGFLWQGGTYASLSSIAQKITGTIWNGPRFFGLRTRPRGTEQP